MEQVARAPNTVLAGSLDPRCLLFEKLQVAKHEVRRGLSKVLKIPRQTVAVLVRGLMAVLLLGAIHLPPQATVALDPLCQTGILPWLMYILGIALCIGCLFLEGRPYAGGVWL